MYYGYIYLTLDQRNGKVYVGQKKGKIKDSLNYFGSGVTIKQIINNQGIYFLKKIILGVCYSKEELDSAEEESIWLFKSYGSDGIHHDNIYGYNLTPKSFGGNITGNHPDKENIYKKCVDTWYSKSEDDKQNIIEKRRSGQKKYYREHPERGEEFSELRSGENSPLYKYIDIEQLIYLQQKNLSMQEIADIMGITRSIVQTRLKQLGIKLDIGRIIKQKYIDHPEKRIEQGNKSRLIQNTPECKENKSKERKQFYTDNPEYKINLSQKFCGKGSSSYKEVDTLKILQLKEEGKSIKELMSIFNVSKYIIKERLKNPEKYL